MRDVTIAANGTCKTGSFAQFGQAPGDSFLTVYNDAEGRWSLSGDLLTITCHAGPPRFVNKAEDWQERLQIIHVDDNSMHVKSMADGKERDFTKLKPNEVGK